MSEKIIIVGGVAGGATTAARLRRLDEKAEIILFERGEYISFANCGLPYHVSGVISNRDSLIVQKADEMAKKFNIDIRIKNEVLSINREEKKVLINDLEEDKTYEESYDKLILSTGAMPVKPQIKGIKEAKNLFTLRNIPDMDIIKEYIKDNTPKKAIVIGGGFIGLEMVENLHHLGINVTLVEMLNQVMAPIDYEMATIVHGHLVMQGVELVLQDGVKELRKNGNRVILNSGKEIDTDLVILAIGVKPENKLALESGLDIGERGGVIVDEYLLTNDPSIYAIGDVIEITNMVSKQKIMIPLAGPANKQARVIANNILGKKQKYKGSIGTSIAKVFDLVVASTGVNEKTLKKLNKEYKAIHLHPGAHADYYPGSSTVSIKVLFNPATEAIYGSQIVGMDGIDKRIDVLSMAIYNNMKVSDLAEVELAYAPPFSSAKDPINLIGTYAENIQNGLVKTIEWDEVDAMVNNGDVFVDVRESIEFDLGTIQGAINIPSFDVRELMNELPKDKPLYLFCHSGIRSYNASRVLAQNGFNVYTLDGGYKTYQCTHASESDFICASEIDDFGFLKDKGKIEEAIMFDNKEVTISLNACGLQCPGPIMEVYNTINKLKTGDVLEVKATDFGFMKDIEVWCKKTNNTLLDVKMENKTIIARIQKGVITSKKVVNSKDDSTIVVFSQDMDKAIAAFIIATGAATLGKKVSLFFTFWGLNILRKPKKVKVKKNFMEKMFGRMMPRGTKKLPISNMNMLGIGPKMIKKIMKKKNVDSLNTLMANAMGLGVKMTACAMSMDIMGIKKEELIDGVEIAGVASYIGDTMDANHNLFI